MDGAGDLLDSRMGRHFADEVAYRMARGTPAEQAPDEAVAAWCARTISRTISRATERQGGNCTTPAPALLA